MLYSNNNTKSEIVNQSGLYLRVESQEIEGFTRCINYKVNTLHEANKLKDLLLKYGADFRKSRLYGLGNLPNSYGYKEVRYRYSSLEYMDLLDFEDLMLNVCESPVSGCYFREIICVNIIEIKEPWSFQKIG